jgi:hypothetical protein
MLKFTVGEYYYCKESVEMTGLSCPGEIAYIAGKKYLCEIPGCLTDEQGCVDHSWGRTISDETLKYFEHISSFRRRTLEELLDD